MKYIIPFIMFVSVCFFPCAGFSQPENHSKDQTLQTLSRYLQQYNHPGWQIKVEKMQADGVDVENFSNDLLNDVTFSDYWNHAIWLLAATEYKTKPVQLAEQMYAQIIRETPMVTKGIRKAKWESVNVLHQLVGPSALKNPELNETLTALVSSLLSKGNLYDPNIWIDKFQLTDLKTKTTLTDDETEAINDAVTTARIFVILFSNMFLLTSDPVYGEIVKRAQSSEFSQINVMAVYLDSERYKEGWKTGRYELFAPMETPDSPSETNDNSKSLSESAREAMKTMKNKK